VPEGEIELTAQYHIEEGSTIVAARVAFNTSANVGQSFQSGDLLIPEVSVFVIGKYGRFELGERAAFPQSLVEPPRAERQGDRRRALPII
jgi:hypothetical protein